jgi:hypothetical protein
MFDSADAANVARQRLLELGLASDDVQVISQDARDEHAAAAHKGLWESIKDFFTDNDERATYEEGVRRGGQLLTARVQDEDADDVLAVLESSDAVDLDQRAQEWRSTGWTGTAATGTAAFEPMAAEVSQSAAAAQLQDTDVTEEVVVGKFEGQRTEGVSDALRRVEVQLDDTLDDEEERDDSLLPGAESSNREPKTRRDGPTRQ